MLGGLSKPLTLLVLGVRVRTCGVGGEWSGIGCPLARLINFSRTITAPSAMVLAAPVGAETASNGTT